MEKVIQDIEESENLSFEEKLNALCEIDDILNDRPKKIRCTPGNAQSIAECFNWSQSPSGTEYWLDLQVRVYGGFASTQPSGREIEEITAVSQPEEKSEIVYIETPRGKVKVEHIGGTPEQRAKAEEVIREIFK